MKPMSEIRVLASVVLALGLAACTPVAEPASAPQVVAATPVEAGRYLVLVGGCNDCHTAGFAPSGGATPEAQQLLGNPVGYMGPWGTSYGVNLRLLAQDVTEEGWVELLRTKKSRPPMPSHNISKYAEADLRAIYQYIHSLGPAGARTPDPLPPGQKPTGPYEDMTIIGLPPGGGPPAV